jgi:Ribonuclease G/E
VRTLDKAVPGKFEDRVRHLVAIDVSMARATNLLADGIKALVVVTNRIKAMKIKN